MTRSKYALPIAAILTLLLSAMLSLSSAAASLEPQLAPIALYGKEILFDVERAGKTVGYHRTVFKVTDGELSVRNTFHVEIKIFFINAFRFHYDSHAVWTRGQLRELNVTVDDDGTAFSLNAKSNGIDMQIESGNGSFQVKDNLFPTNHWNANVLGQTRVLNTLTGHINQVRIDAAGQELIMTENGYVMATKYRYSGELENEAWYDGAGRWVKLAFKGRDGTPITYKCRRCQGGEPRP